MDHNRLNQTSCPWKINASQIGLCAYWHADAFFHNRRMISILLADDHDIFRKGLRALLSVHDDLNVIGEAEDGRTTLRLAHLLLPDIVVMDLAMPLLNGVEVTRQLTRDLPATKVLV